MRALVLEAAKEFAVREVEKPVPASGEALIRVRSAGICGSEMHAYLGRHPKRRPPAVMGHEVCGVVEALGPDTAGPALGTRVVVMPQKSCGVCRWCRDNKHNLCDTKIMLGETSWPGGYAEYFTAPVDLLYHVPERLSDDAATLVEPLSVATHAVRTAGVGLGDRVAVLGAGAIGLMTVLAARAAGASDVLASDVCDFNLHKAGEMGANCLCNARTDDMVRMALDMTRGFGVDHLFMAVDAPGLFEQAIQATRKQGVLTMIALFTELRQVNLQIPKYKELHIKGSLTFDHEDFRVAVDLARNTRVNLDDFVTHRFPLEQGGQAFELVRTHAEDQVRVVIHP